MSKYKSLSGDEISEISSAHYKQRERKTSPRNLPEQPVITFVAAQPGAGKSAAATDAKNTAKQHGGYIHVDADVMRRKIPIFGDSKPTSEETQVDAGRLANAVRALAIEGRRNIIEEGTLRNPGVMCKEPWNRCTIKATRLNCWR
jgi:hypothetical protein